MSYTILLFILSLLIAIFMGYILSILLYRLREKTFYSKPQTEATISQDRINKLLTMENQGRSIDLVVDTMKSQKFDYNMGDILTHSEIFSEAFVELLRISPQEAVLGQG